MRVAVLLALAACAKTPEPSVRILNALDGHEPTVRVHLRSLGDEWASVKVSGKGGLAVRTKDREFATQKPVVLRRGAGETHFRPLEGVFTVDGHTYSGELDWKDGRLINRVSLENYVLGVLRGELPLPKVPEAAAAAQAIAVRSYTFHYLVQERARGFDVDDTTFFQRYVGLQYAPDDSALRAGVRRTFGLYLAHEGRPLKAYYHSTCGGHTTDEKTGLGRNDAPSLRGVSCEHCKASKYWRWQARLSDAEVEKAAHAKGTLAVLESGPGKRARKLQVGGKVVHAGEFRLAVGPSKLRSVRILELARVDGGYRVEGAGWGHGVGLCQMGAIGLGKSGKTGREIAQYYYPAATIRRAY